MKMSWLKKFFYLPPSEISAEREEELIEKIANTISNLGMEEPAIVFVSGLIPTSTVLSQTVLFPLAPVLELMGINAFEYVALFGKRENVKRLLDKIEKLRTSKS